MSEYQYYEFRTVNRTLTSGEVKEVNSWSSRGDVNSTSASFTYNFGDFKYDPMSCLLSHFDMMLYHANYGCRRMMFRFPKKIVNISELRQFEYSFPEQDYERSIAISDKKDFVVIDIEENLEEGYEDWVECEDVLAAVTPLWNDIINGDYRSLYLIWSHFSQLALDNESIEEDNLTIPNMPSGLKKMSAPLTEFNNFWWVDGNLIADLAKKSPDKTEKNTDYEKAISLMSDNEKSDYLLRFAQNEEYILQKFLKRLEKLV